MSEGRGLTLRKKKKDRPKISGPQQSSAANTVAKPSPQRNSQSGLTVPKDSKAPSETSDLVKRRYSTRYNQLPDFSASGTPAVPSLPAGLKRASRGGSPRRPDGSFAQPLFVDVDLLADANLQHDRYVSEILSTASEQDIQEYQNNLQKIKKRTSEELKNSVYQNRTQFIKISKEAEKLKTEMTVLQSLMSDLTTTLSQTNSTATNGSLSPDLNENIPRRGDHRRSSVANLESLWNVQLQALWKNIEKSQKFLPAIPGRHVIMETGAWVELDSATWKARRPVHIVLLNDHLLIASKKRKRVDPDAAQQGPAPTKLVAEECFPLEDVEVEDLKTSIAAGKANPADERAITASIMVRAAGKTLTYRVEKRDENLQKDLLMNVRKAMEDVRKANKASTDIARQSSQRMALNYFAARDPASAKPEIIDGINGTNTTKPDILIDVDGKQQNFRWVESQIDDLDIDIALHRFETAVDNIETLRRIAKGLKTSNMAQELILAKVDERASRLATHLSRDLVDKSSFLGTVKRNTSYMIRLGFEDRARETYLGARSDQLSKRAKQCVFEGDLHQYVFSISFVYFTIIKNTILIYQASFTQQTALSAVIKWANDHLEEFNRLLRRQVGSVEREGKVWRECMDVVWAHERECLGEIGCDFREVVGRGLEVRDSGVGGKEREKVPGGGVGTAVNGTDEKVKKNRSKSRGRE